MVRYISGKLSLFYDAMNKKHTFSINLEFSSKQNHLRNSNYNNFNIKLQ